LQSLTNSLDAPKKSGGALGVHKADPRVAPATSNDFSVNQAADQSTENNPDDAHVTYETHDADQSIENNPEASGIEYETYDADQSRE
jgi:hypothetical protein